jgi:F0F1-type ATP synthase assembly protein I
MGLSFGINFTVLGLLGGWAGRALDQRLGTGPWLLVVGITGGVMLAFYSLIKEIMVLDEIRVADEAAEKNKDK